MPGDVTFQNLLGQSLNARDPFLAAACHPHANCHDRRALESILFATSKLKRQFAVARYTPASILDSLAEGRDERISLRVAKHPSTAPATLAKMERTTTAQDLCARVAGHRNTLRGTLENLYRKHPNSAEIKRGLCNNPHTPLRLLRRLAADAAPAELKGVARNPEADAALLRLCWDRGDLYLQAEVAAHPKCAPDMRDLAERSPHAIVRRKLAQNPALAGTVLMRLLGDSEAQVRATAVRNLSKSMIAGLDSGGRDPSSQVRRDQARHTGLPQSWIKRLATDSDSWVRRLIARNQTTSEEVLYSLADDAVMEVRRGVARNPVCPMELLLRLARDPHPWVRAGVALRADVVEPLLIELARDKDIEVLSALGKNPNAPIEILDRVILHKDRDVRRAVILNENAPRRILCGLLEDPYPLNRVMLAGHGNLRDEDLLGLMHDPEPTVRFAAAHALAVRSH